MNTNGFSFFTLPDVTQAVDTLAIDAKGDPKRRRVQHRKSKTGCGNCKRKKIKCDEKLPACTSCAKKILDCDVGSYVRRRPAPSVASRPSIPSPGSKTTSVTQATASSTIGTDPAPSILDGIDGLNIVLQRSTSERELLLHYEKYTSKALAMSPVIWSAGVLRSAFEYDYVMDAILAVTSAHINHYLPLNDAERKPDLQYFSRALVGLQVGVVQTLTASRLESILSCSTLISHICLTHIETCPSGSFDIGSLFEQTVELGQGLKSCVVQGFDMISATEWGPVLKYRPTANLERYSRESGVDDDEFARLFTHFIFCGQGTRIEQNSTADNLNAAKRLMIPLHAMFAAWPDVKATGYTSDILRYLFTWPSFCTAGFVQQVKDGNMTSLTILFYYYSAILGMYSDKIWYMKDRSMYMHNALRKILQGRCDKCTEPALYFYNAGDTLPVLPREQSTSCFDWQE